MASTSSPSRPATDQPSLTVVVTFKDCEETLSTTLRSLRPHGDDRIRLLLVDDGSTDGTRDELAAFTERHPAAELVEHRRSRGVAASRNDALAGVGTDWIAFLDGTDFAEKGYYSTLLDTADRAGCDFVRTDHVRVDGTVRSVVGVNSELRDGSVGSPREAILPLGQETAVEETSVWAGCYHRRLAERGLLNFRTDLDGHEGLPWMWRLHLRADSFTVAGLRGVFRQAREPGTGVRDSFAVIKSLDAMVAEVRADPEADRFMAKALFLYAGAIVGELRRARHDTKPRRKTLTLLCAESLAELPRKPLKEAIKRLDENSRATIKELIK